MTITKAMFRNLGKINRLSALFLAGASLAACSHDDGCRVVLLGDSIAFEIAQKMSAQSADLGYNFNVVNAAVRGSGLYRSPRTSDQLSKIQKGDHVIISAGANDILSAGGTIKNGKYEAAYHEFIADIKKRGGQPILIDYHVTANKFFNAGQSKIINENINGIIRAVALHNNIPVVSTENAARYDGIHVTATGADDIMGRVWTQTPISKDLTCSLSK